MNSNKKCLRIIVFLAFISMLISLISPSFNTFATTKTSIQNNGAVSLTAKFTDGNTIRDGMVKTLEINYDILNVNKLNEGDKLVVDLPDIFSNITPKYSRNHFSDCEISGHTLTLTFNKHASSSGLKGYLSLLLQTSNDIKDQKYPVIINTPGYSQTIYLNGEARHDSGSAGTQSPVMYKGNFLNQDGNYIGVITDSTNIPYYVEINRPGHDPQGNITNRDLYNSVFVDNMPKGMRLNESSVTITKNTWNGRFDYRDAPIFTSEDVTQELLNSKKLIKTPYSLTLNIGFVYWYESYSIRYSTFVVSKEDKYSNTANFSYSDPYTHKKINTISTSDARLSSDAGALNVTKTVDKNKVTDSDKDQTIKYTIKFDSDGSFDKGVASITDTLDPRLSDIKIVNVTNQFTTYFSNEIDKKTGKKLMTLHASNDNGPINSQNPAYITIQASMKNVNPGEEVKNTAYVNGNPTNEVSTKKNPEVKILKIDKNDTKKNPTSIGGAVFKLTTKDGKSVKDVYGRDQSTITSLSNKALTLELPYGSYILTEIKAPEGYKLDQKPINFTVDDNTRTLQIIAKDTLLPQTFNLNIKKIDDNGNPLLGAKFNLYKESDIKNPLKFINQKSTNIYDLNNFGIENLNPIGKDASLSINKLPYGNYILKEVKSPNGYLLSDNIYITIDPKESFYTIGKDGVKVNLTKDSKTNSYTISVVNKHQIILPETGGNGTYNFYLIGSVLLLISIMLISSSKLISIKKDKS